MFFVVEDLYGWPERLLDERSAFCEEEPLGLAVLLDVELRRPLRGDRRGRRHRLARPSPYPRTTLQEPQRRPPLRARAPRLAFCGAPPVVSVPPRAERSARP